MLMKTVLCVWFFGDGFGFLLCFWRQFLRGFQTLEGSLLELDYG